MHQTPPTGLPAQRAERLAADLALGASLPELPSPVMLKEGEVLHAQGDAYGWRYHGLDVSVEEQRLLAFGGPVVLGLVAAANAVGKRRARAEAERLAAPQWRSLGLLPILATSQRLLVFHDGQWASVWFSVIRQLRPDPVNEQLQIVFEDDPPYALAGSWVPYLTVVLVAVLANDRGVDAVQGSLLPA